MLGVTTFAYAVGFIGLSFIPPSLFIGAAEGPLPPENF
jgi:hypothetical protein